MRIPLLLFACLFLPCADVCRGEVQEAEKKGDDALLLDDQNLNLNSLSKEQYIKVCEALIKESEKPRIFQRKSKRMLITMLGLEKKPESHGIFDLDPIWNRSVLFVILAVGNKIKLDDEDMENFKTDTARVALKTQDEALRVIIAGIYGIALSENTKIPGAPAQR